MTAATRIYIVLDDRQDQHLVRATHPQAAIARLVRNRFSVRLAEQEDLVRLLGSGAKVIDQATPSEPDPDFFEAEHDPEELLSLP